MILNTEGSIYRSKLLQEAIARVNDPNYRQNEKTYKCSMCEDTGFIAITFDGAEKSSLNVPSAEGCRMKPCACKIKQQHEESLKHTGIDLIEYKTKSLETFKRDTVLAMKMYDMAIKFINDPDAKGIGYFGKSGTGKTHICIAICNELVKQGIIHKYFNYRRDMQNLKSLMFDEENYNKKLSEYLTIPVLYMDDFLKLAKNNNGSINIQELQIAFDIVNTRYINKKKIIMSSEYTIAEIKEIDEALGSRLFEMINPYGLKVEGENRRFKAV